MVEKTAFQESNTAKIEPNLLDNEMFLRASGAMPVPIGVAADDTIVIRDISLFPHMLVCGTTGAGKTAFVQTILAVLMTAKEQEWAKIAVIDSKQIEYRPFSKSQQLLLPIACDNNMASATLKYINTEIKRRFSLLSAMGCKSIDTYNSKAEASGIHEKLAHVFVVIDDFAMTLEAPDNKLSLTEILKNGRIAGVHLMLVTSATTATVLQKDLLANISCRFVFRVTSKATSKMLIGQYGAEELRVPGEMIYHNQNESIKCQCAYSDYQNIQNAIYSHSVQQNMKLSRLGELAADLFAVPAWLNKPIKEKQNDSYDDLLVQVGDMIIESQKASIGNIQRVFRIGFNRAARILDELADVGLVEAEDGTGERNILFSAKEWKSACESRGLHSSIATKQKSPEKALVKPIVKTIRDFADFSIGGKTIGISDGKIRIQVPVTTKYGPGTSKAEMDAISVKKLIYKKPGMFSRGLLQFIIKDGTNVYNRQPFLIDVDKSNVSDYLRIEFDRKESQMVRLFVKQVSEDTGAPIEE